MRGYLLALLGLMLLTLAGTLGVSSFGLGQCTLRDRNVCGLYHYQEAKLSAAPDKVDVLFLGDSSLGNAIDARHFAALSGKTTLSLALSGGVLGLPAVYTQIRDAVPRMKISNLVLMISPEDYRHHFFTSADGYVFANHAHLLRSFDLPPRFAMRSLDSLARSLFDDSAVSDGWRYLTTGERDLGDCDGCASLDYIAQGPRRDLTLTQIKQWQGPFKDYDPFLERIARICAEENINCLYSHGSILQSVLDLNPGYVAEIDRTLEKIGLKPVAPGPVIIPPDEVGDSANHVRPDLRAAYTEKFYRQLAPLLK